jgi:hypothetical protein
LQEVTDYRCGSDVEGFECGLLQGKGHGELHGPGRGMGESWG